MGLFSKGGKKRKIPSVSDATPVINFHRVCYLKPPRPFRRETLQSPGCPSVLTSNLAVCIIVCIIIRLFNLTIQS